MLLDDCDEKKSIKKAARTRWLGHSNAETSLKDIYSAVLANMGNAVESGIDRGCVGTEPSAASLLKMLKTYQIINIIHFQCDALKPVIQLSLTFEKVDNDLSIVYPEFTLYIH